MIISIRDRSMTAIASFLFLFLFAMGCASGGGGADEASSGSSVLEGGKSIGRLAISVGDELAPAAAETIEQFSIIRDLDSGVRRELVGGGMSDGGSLSADIKIIELRVRSTASAIMWGMMAGVDTITVDVTITERGETLKNFRKGTSTALGGFAYGGRGKRITRMLDTLSKRIAAGL